MATQEVTLPLTPTALLTRCVDEPHVFALDGGDTRSWGSGCALLGFRPRATLRVAASGEAVVCDGMEQHWHGEPFALLERFRRVYAGPTDGVAQRFAGGTIVALSYDLRTWVERLPTQARDDLGLPVLHAAAYDWMLSYDYAQRQYRLASAVCSAAELRALAAQIEELAARPLRDGSVAATACVRPGIDRPAYLRAARAVLEYIAAGDVYQVNLAQRFIVSDPPTPAALYATLQRQHAVPFAAYVAAGDFVLVSNSPECFLTLGARTLTTFPIKGTRRRGKDAAADERLMRELLQDPKERAEHVMIVDLERSDLGRVCRTGSVRVEEFARLHSFPSLHHLVSTIAGDVRSDVTFADILRATFPGGSITGAPKIRAMEIIDELEPVCRGFYTGAIGFIGLDGHAVFNLAIRTAVAAGGKITYHAGGGIVADSIPHGEYEETLLKAQPFFHALSAERA